MQSHDALTDAALRQAALRFWAKADVGGEDECWPWLAANNGSTRKDDLAYGVFLLGLHGTRNTSAHRAAYILTHGPIDKKIVVDHKCRNTLCVNPKHLEAE